jgi:hypothetical protein
MTMRLQVLTTKVLPRITLMVATETIKIHNLTKMRETQLVKKSSLSKKEVEHKNIIIRLWMNFTIKTLRIKTAPSGAMS